MTQNACIINLGILLNTCISVAFTGIYQKPDLLIQLSILIQGGWHLQIGLPTLTRKEKKKGLSTCYESSMEQDAVKIPLARTRTNYCANLIPRCL